ncbi:type II secretion system protein GspF, partial [Pseudoalteromonas spongiae]
PKIRYWFDARVLQFPIIGKVARGLNTSRYARTLSNMSSRSEPQLEGKRISGEVLENEKMKAPVAEAA